MDASHVQSQQQLIARMVEALVDARAQIQADRQSLHDSTVQADGSIDSDDQPLIDEYDRVLEQISVALDYAKGDAA